MPAALRRLRWNRAQISAFQTQRLREIVLLARQASPWHAARLRGVDASITPSSLARLPVMTKDDVLEHFDDIVTDRRLTLQRARDHLETAKPDALLFGEYRIVTSAGSTGRVGVWPFEQGAWSAVQATNARMMLRARIRRGEILHRPMTAVVGASHRTHVSVQIVRGFSEVSPLREFPVTMPFPAILKGLQELQPDVLAGYPSMLAEIALAQREGRLRIAPEYVVCSAEPMPDEHRKLLEETWSVTVANVWATSEAGAIASGDFERPGMVLNEDMVICEPVDLNGHPIQPGETADRVYVTSLFNHSLPLIRYELCDAITLQSPDSDSGLDFSRIADIQGRFDEVFDYGDDVRVHTHVFRSALSHEPSMTDYQIRQTPGGVRLLLRASGPVDPEATRRRIEQRLRDAGLRDPRVEVEIVEQIERLPSGKIKRYVPMYEDVRGRGAA